MLNIKTNKVEETIELGRNLGRCLRPGVVVLLKGDLGAGKTHFSKGVALGLNITDHITSPTYNLINEYEGSLHLYHMDLYRLADEEEAYELGLEEYFLGSGVSLVEWPDRAESLLPDNLIEVKIAKGDTEEREFTFIGIGPDEEKIIEELAACMS